MEELESASTPKEVIDEASKIIDQVKSITFKKYQEMIHNPTEQTTWEHARDLSTMVEFAKWYHWNISPQQVIYDLINVNQLKSAHAFTLRYNKDNRYTLSEAIKDKEYKTIDWLKETFKLNSSS